MLDGLAGTFAGTLRITVTSGAGPLAPDDARELPLSLARPPKCCPVCNRIAPQPRKLCHSMATAPLLITRNEIEQIVRKVVLERVGRNGKPGLQNPLVVHASAVVVSAVFLLVGILGFIPGITTHYGDLSFAGHDSGAQLLGVFQVSVLHNLVHLLFGIVGMALARAADTARTYLLGGGVVYLALWVLGFPALRGVTIALHPGASRFFGARR